MSEIYGDLYFLINFSMDLICLYLTGAILRLKLSLKRLIFSALLGGLYSLLALFIKGGSFFSFLLTLITAFVLCFCAFFKKGGARIYALSTLLFFAISFFMGGALTYIYSAIGRLMPPLAFEGPSVLLLPCSIICALLSFVLSRISERRISGKRVEITVITDRSKHSFSAFVDTGNLLCEPMSALPVVILSCESSKKYVFRGIFTPEEVLQYPEVKGSIRIIPVKSTSGSGTLVGFIPSGGVMIGDRVKKCCVAFSDTESFNGAQSLLPSTLM